MMIIFVAMVSSRYYPVETKPWGIYRKGLDQFAGNRDDVMLWICDGRGLKLEAPQDRKRLYMV